MIKPNVWEIVNKEVAIIIKEIEKGEIKTHKEISEYLDGIYGWKVAGAVASVVNGYARANDIEIPWDYETEESAE